jgi:hypothetical protein
MQTNTEIMDASVRNGWVWGFTPQAESWNGRLAMIGFVSAIAIEALSQQGLLHFWGILSSGIVPIV